MNHTEIQYQEETQVCRAIFLNKTADYGTSWRVYRTISVVDQIYIKAKRIKTIQQKGTQKVGDDIRSEFRGMLNYAVIGLIQGQLDEDATEQLPVDQLSSLYDQVISSAMRLMQDKNHDYGEAWREMSQESFIDLILAKLLRIKQILTNDGKTIVSEGVDANFYDILNYAAFGLILMQEGKHTA